MYEPAELVLIQDQYQLAFQSLSGGLAAEEAGRRSEALLCYRKAQLHLSQGLDIPTGGDRHHGPAWDWARLLQQKMRDTFPTIAAHVSNLEMSLETAGHQKGLVLNDLPPPVHSDSRPPEQQLYPSIPAPPHQLYPSIPAPTPSTAPTSPAAPLTDTLVPATMDNPGEPPAYTPQPTDGHRSLGPGPAGATLGPGPVGAGLGSGTWSGRAGGNRLLSIPSGVQLFFLEPSGQVSSLSYPGYLQVFRLEDEQKDAAAGAAFLHVCDRLYLLTSQTPVLLASSGIFMFPDTLAERPGSYVGIVLSSELPAADKEMFQDLLSQLADLRIQGPEGPEAEVLNLSTKVPLGPLHEKTGPPAEKDKLPLPGWSEKMAQGILTGASRLGESLAKGAEATGKVIHKGAAKIRDHITPEDVPSEVSPRVSKGLNVARKATGGAVRVSQFLVTGVSTIAEQVADKVAPHVKKHGAKLIPESMKKTQDGQASSLDGAKFVAASGVQGFSTVWSSLETGAKHVCKSVAAETVQTVKYKYGDDASLATDAALHSLANAGLTAHNIDNLGIKAFLKTAGKKTAKALMRGHEGQPTGDEETGVQTEEHVLKRFPWKPETKLWSVLVNMAKNSACSKDYVVLQADLEDKHEMKETIEESVSDLRRALEELEKLLHAEEGNEWKTRFDIQVDLKGHLQRQISEVHESLEMIRGPSRNQRSLIRSYDVMSEEMLQQRLELLTEEKLEVQTQLKKLLLQIQQEGKVFHKTNDERRAYLSEISQKEAE